MKPPSFDPRSFLLITLMFVATIIVMSLLISNKPNELTSNLTMAISLLPIPLALYFLIRRYIASRR